jgi:hypothetical protein
MQTILLVLKRPSESDGTGIDRWCKAVETVNRIATPNKGVQTLTSGCWQIDAEFGLSVLGRGICAAEEAALSYKVLFFNESPELPASV